MALRFKDAKATKAARESPATSKPTPVEKTASREDRPKKRRKPKAKETPEFVPHKGPKEAVPIEDAANDATNDTSTIAPEAPGIDIASKFGAAAAAKFASAPPPKTSTTSTTSAPITAKPPKHPSEPQQPAATGEMILVTVNDRLGTKAQIPCLASDTIGDFKKIVAMKIGRKPHEIMVKRQGERPFKDMLTLEDYGVGSGVQLDLELDTGD